MMNTNVNDVVNAKKTNIINATPAYGYHVGSGVPVTRCHPAAAAAAATVTAVHAHVASSILTPIRSPNTDIALRPCVMRATRFMCD